MLNLSVKDKPFRKNTAKIRKKKKEKVMANPFGTLFI